MALSFSQTITAFDVLAGRHRIQRVPPNEKRGRRHSSEVQVTVLELHRDSPALDRTDVDITVSRGTGPGGQHRNKTESAVKAVHIPTGLSAYADSRSQHQNRIRAIEVLTSRIAQMQAQDQAASLRSDKNRQREGVRAYTWTEWRDTVVNHRTGREAPMAQVLRGRLDLLVG